MMTFLDKKTKIVCTIGPASESFDTIVAMLNAGMNIARLNFSHGDFDWHARAIATIRRAAESLGKQVVIMADLPGPKIRIGHIADEPITLEKENFITLTTRSLEGTVDHVSVCFPNLPLVVKPGNILYLNDGIIQVEVISIFEEDIRCRVISGGELRSYKGLNLPNIDLGISAFTERDQQCLTFALEHGVDAVSQSFVNSRADVDAVREYSRNLGYTPFIIAKIERAGALELIEEILSAADGVMIARGDLGVETQIERIAIVQKQLTRLANQLGKPVITATQMLESMVTNFRPTRAEATDVSNAILDGTDCIMLSEESAMGMYPIEAVSVLARIASAIEPMRTKLKSSSDTTLCMQHEQTSLTDVIALNVKQTVETIQPVAVFVHTQTGYTARMIARYKLPVWIVAVSRSKSVYQQLVFSYGVYPYYISKLPENWNIFIQDVLSKEPYCGEKVVLTEGPSPEYPSINPRVEIISLTNC